LEADPLRVGVEVRLVVENKADEDKHDLDGYDVVVLVFFFAVVCCLMIGRALLHFFLWLSLLLLRRVRREQKHDAVFDTRRHDNKRTGKLYDL